MWWIPMALPDSVMTDWLRVKNVTHLLAITYVPGIVKVPSHADVYRLVKGESPHLLCSITNLVGLGIWSS